MCFKSRDLKYISKSVLIFNLKRGVVGIFCPESFLDRECHTGFHGTPCGMNCKVLKSKELPKAKSKPPTYFFFVLFKRELELSGSVIIHTVL